jgi:hypothetical protein
MKDSIKEGLKELGRVALIGALPVLMASIDGSGHIFIDYKVLAAAVFIAVLRAVDKWVHNDPDINSKGILPF